MMYHKSKMLEAAIKQVSQWFLQRFGREIRGVITLDFNGTCFVTGGNAFHPLLAASIYRAMQAGYLVVPATDNPSAGIDAWLRHGGINPSDMPIRVVDHGSRIMVRMDDEPEWACNLVDDRLIHTLEDQFTQLNERIARDAEKAGLAVVWGHPTTTDTVIPPHGTRGAVIFDKYRTLGGSAEFQRNAIGGGVLGKDADVEHMVHKMVVQHAEALKIDLGDVELFHFFFLPPAVGTVKADAIELLYGCIPEEWMRVHIGDSARNERGVNHLPHVNVFAPHGESFGREAGVYELAHGCLDGAVPEMISCLIGLELQYMQ